MKRTDEIYLVATIGVRKTSFGTRIKHPTSLAPNQFCFKFRIGIDTEKWKKRVKEIDLGEIEPPEALSTEIGDELLVGKTTPQRIMDRLQGR